MNLLKSDDYPAIYEDYIENVQGDVMEELQNQLELFPQFIKEIPKEKELYTYAEGKWTVKEILCHIIDTERVMSYRALRFARNDMTALASFEQDEFVTFGRHNEREIDSIIEEFKHLRAANIALFKTFNEVELTRKGMASDRLISVLAFIYVIAGHLNHHQFILQQKYLNS
ncbi:DinB family protein [Sphingobacterium bovistauri]|uniref:DinB family protein n=1 Tax=Sphingobacterium bovistauri TaxID=2781959 RepID=A0ABS7Z785_9SPHI|nr:DinB family protein [Sphingobacterium bovistauri]MCA5006045.1 DinB family protein [Sphingobacterium bovistauri]